MADSTVRKTGQLPTSEVYFVKLNRILLTGISVLHFKVLCCEGEGSLKFSLFFFALLVVLIYMYFVFLRL